MTKTRALAIAALAALILLAAAGGSEACSVCIDPSSASRKAFSITAVVLSLMPMVLVGGVLLYIRREVKRR